MVIRIPIVATLCHIFKGKNLLLQRKSKGLFGEGKWNGHVFSTNVFEGELKSSEEGTLQWFDLSDIPFDEMWSDDRYWLPLVIRGKSFQGDFYFDKEGKTILDFELNS
jgi:hypothetical protein